MRLDRLSRLALFALLLWAPLAIGANRDWSLAILQLLTLVGLLLWVLRMVAEGHLEWRRSALDLPLVLLIVLVLGQLVLGNRVLANWALAPAPSALDVLATLPSVFFTLGTVAPAHTARSLLVLLTYTGAYVLVVNLIRTREQLDRLVMTLVSFGGVLAFCALLDYLVGEAWLLRWRDIPLAGRLAATFGNPDHFAAWLAMVICLGLGALAARRSGAETRLGSLLHSREAREDAVRRYLPFLGLIVMALALVFTLSRGGVLSVLLTFLVLLAVLGRLGRIRWHLAVVGALVVIALGYAAWIGLEPFLARVRHADYANRWVLARTTVPMLRSFPLFGVGLGAYGDAYPRYQPAVLQPGRIDVIYAHNDLLQLVVELGLVGTVIAGLMSWRVGKDLLGAHLFGTANCPVGGGEDEGARRHDTFSVGLAVGAVGAVLALIVHGTFDFGAHIPANGVLAATCLGIATVALHTRFSVGGPRLLTTVRRYSLGSRRARLAVGAVAVVLSLALGLWVIRPPIVAAILHDAERPTLERPTALHRIDAALTLDPRNERARAVRARLRLDAALETWNLGATLDKRVLLSWDERRGAGLPLVHGAIADLRAALAVTPADPFLHDSLAKAVWVLAVLDAQHASDHLSATVASFSRAVAAAPHSPFAYRSLAIFAVPQGGPFTDLGLRAARGAVERDPTMLPGLVDRFVPLGLSATQWIAAVPDSALDRLELGALLDKRRLPSEAAQVYRAAIEITPGKETAVPRWMLARLLLRQGHPQEALEELQLALRANARDPGDPELHLERARALAALEDAGALDAYQLALLSAEVRARWPVGDQQAFGALPPRTRTLVSDILGARQEAGPARYRQALAQYLTDREFWAEALTQWEMVIAESPTNAAAHVGRGLAFDNLGAREQAVDAYRQAVALDGSNVAVRLRLAQRLWETDQYYQAINEWRAVLAQAPGNLDARMALVRAYVRTDNRADAAAEYQRLLQIAPDQSEIRRQLPPPPRS